MAYFTPWQELNIGKVRKLREAGMSAVDIARQMKTRSDQVSLLCRKFAIESKVAMASVERVVEKQTWQDTARDCTRDLLKAILKHHPERETKIRTDPRNEKVIATAEVAEPKQALVVEEKAPGAIKLDRGLPTLGDGGIADAALLAIKEIKGNTLGAMIKRAAKLYKIPAKSINGPTTNDAAKRAQMVLIYLLHHKAGYTITKTGDFLGLSRHKTLRAFEAVEVSMGDDPTFADEIELILPGN